MDQSLRVNLGIPPRLGTIDKIDYVGVERITTLSDVRRRQVISVKSYKPFILVVMICMVGALSVGTAGAG